MLVSTVMKFSGNTRIRDSITTISNLISIGLNRWREISRVIESEYIDILDRNPKFKEHVDVILGHYMSAPNLIFTQPDEDTYPGCHHDGVFTGIDCIYSYVKEDVFVTKVRFSIEEDSLIDGGFGMTEVSVVLNLVDFIRFSDDNIRLHLLLYLESILHRFFWGSYNDSFLMTMFSVLSLTISKDNLDDLLDRLICDDFMWFVMANGTLFQYSYSVILYEGILGTVILDVLNPSDFHYYEEIDNAVYDVDTRSYYRDTSDCEIKYKIQDVNQLMAVTFSSTLDILQKLNK
jgi:hypothetical protein